MVREKADRFVDGLMVDLFGQSAVLPERLQELDVTEQPERHLDPLIFALLAARKLYRLPARERPRARGMSLEEWAPQVMDEGLASLALAEPRQGKTQRIEKPQQPASEQSTDWRGDPTVLTTEEADAYKESRTRIHAYVQQSKDKFVSGGSSVDQLEREIQTIISTEVQAVVNEAAVIAAVKNAGDNARVRRIPEGGACADCLRLFLGPDGAPIIFSVPQILSYGTNAGRQKRDWMPTLWPIHPNCRCSVEPVEEAA